jgi:long-chain acyl-CoA synthetase
MGEMGFWGIAKAHRSRPLLISPAGEETTAGELLDASNKLVHALRALDLTEGAAVAVAMKNRAAFLELYLAAAQAGFYLIPINARLAAPEIAYVLQNSGARVLVCDADTASNCLRAVASIGFPRDSCFAIDAAPTSGFNSYTEWRDTSGHPSTEPPNRCAGATLFYTSGTTGKPKAVKRPLPNGSPDSVAATLARLRLRSVGISGRDLTAGDSSLVHLVVAPLYHSASLAWCLAHVHMGHTIVLMDEWRPEAMLELIERHRVTGTLMVPTHFHRLLALGEDKRARYDVSSLRHVVHGGAPCPVEIKKRMMAWWGPVIHEVYGAAEAATGTHVGPEEWLSRPGTVGKSNGQVRILRDEKDATECAPREVGLVYFDSGGKHFEYLDDPEKTAASRAGQLFTVGDLGYLDEDGYLFLCDRKSDVIISGGVNIYPAEVECVLTEHPAVADVAVFGVPDVEWGEQVKAVVELANEANGNAALAEALIAHCRERLAGFKIPRSIEFGALQREPNGKLDKRRVRDRVLLAREGREVSSLRTEGESTE